MHEKRCLQGFDVKNLKKEDNSKTLKVDGGKHDSIYSRNRLKGAEWVELAQDRDKCLKAVINLRVPSNAGNFLTR
jgi:hypothetical protein